VSRTPTVSLAPGMSARLPISAATSEPDRAETDSREWLRVLRGSSSERDEAVGRLHELLVRAARFEVSRRRAALSHVRGEELDDIALQAADDALVAVLAKLDDYRGASRFTTWAYKFALLEAGVRLRRRSWQEREVVLEPEAWPLMADAGQTPQDQAETSELMQALRYSIDGCLTDPPARGAGRARAQRRAARRTRRPSQHDAWRAVQDPARRAPETALRPRAQGLYARLDLAERSWTRTRVTTP
jgi:DNA-directed RNA polymerase specialized sigma24 family protein